MGFIFQFYNLIPDLTVEENVQVVAEMADVVVRIKDGVVDSLTENASKKTADEIEL